MSTKFNRCSLYCFGRLQQAVTTVKTRERLPKLRYYSNVKVGLYFRALNRYYSCLRRGVGFDHQSESHHQLPDYTLAALGTGLNNETFRSSFSIDRLCNFYQKECSESLGIIHSENCISVPKMEAGLQFCPSTIISGRHLLTKKYTYQRSNSVRIPQESTSVLTKETSRVSLPLPNYRMFSTNNARLSKYENVFYKPQSRKADEGSRFKFDKQEITKDSEWEEKEEEEEEADMLLSGYTEEKEVVEVDGVRGHSGQKKAPSWAREWLRDCCVAETAHTLGCKEEEVHESEIEWGWVDSLTPVMLARLRWMFPMYETLLGAGKPAPLKITANMWKTNLLPASFSMFKFVRKMELKANAERNKLNQKKEQQEKKQDVVPGNERTGWEADFRTIFLWHTSKAVRSFYYQKALMEMAYSQPIMVDCCFNSYMNTWTRNNPLLTALFKLHQHNLDLANPFRLVYAGLPKDPASTSPFPSWYPGDVQFPKSQYKQWLTEGVFDSLEWTNTSSLQEAVERRPLVYVTPASDTFMRRFDKDTVYIIEGLTYQGKDEHRNLSYNHAVDNNIPTVKLPTQLSAKWHTINRDQVSCAMTFEILSTLRETGSWELALDTLPHRLLDPALRNECGSLVKNALGGDNSKLQKNFQRDQFKQAKFKTEPPRRTSKHQKAVIHGNVQKFDSW